MEENLDAKEVEKFEAEIQDALDLVNKEAERLRALMTPEDQSALAEFWRRESEKEPSFAHAYTTFPLKFQAHGQGTLYFKKARHLPKGTKVLVTTGSRFGDVGFRTFKIDEPAHGYEYRCMPEKLTNWTFLPMKKRRGDGKKGADTVGK